MTVFTQNNSCLRWYFVVSWACMVFFHATLKAQSKEECELIAQRIAGTGNVNSICRSVYKVCTLEADKKNEPKEAHNQCLKNLGDCQMAGQLSGEDLKRVIDQYEIACKAQ